RNRACCSSSAASGPSTWVSQARVCFRSAQSSATVPTCANRETSGARWPAVTATVCAWVACQCVVRKPSRSLSISPRATPCREIPFLQGVLDDVVVDPRAFREGQPGPGARLVAGHGQRACHATEAFRDGHDETVQIGQFELAAGHVVD